MRILAQRNTDTEWGTSKLKRKLTAVESELLPVAKRYARLRGVSWSSLVKASLRTVATEEISPFSERWRGRFEEARREDARYEALARKYL